MVVEDTMKKLQQDEDMAYFHANLCLCPPGSYTLNEKREIYNDMMRTSKAQLDTMREDFENMTPEMQAKLLNMFCQSGVKSPQWWQDVLVGKGDPIYRDFKEILRIGENQA